MSAGWLDTKQTPMEKKKEKKQLAASHTIREAAAGSLQVKSINWPVSAVIWNSL